MELRFFVLCCTLISSISAFKLPHELKQLNDSNILAVVSQTYDNGVCLEKCGASPGVLCEVDVSQTDGVKCTCLDKNKLFDIVDKECKGCQCKNGKCVKDSKGKTKCICQRGYSIQDEKTCEPCDCGKRSKCIFLPVPKTAGGMLYIKRCLCDVGSAEKDGICIDCHCGENSKCEFEDGEKNCYCIDGFAETDGVCTKCDCGDHGECTFQNGRKICNCDDDFEEVNGYCVDKCKAITCHNGGDCYVEEGKPLCECTDEFEGDDCSLHKCTAINCYNGGLCEVDEGKPVCKCTEGYLGEDCQKHLCDDVLCENGGMCEVEEGNAICKCTELYEGEDCMKHKCERLPCYNGGTCHVEEGLPVCKCHDEYEGEVCEKHKCDTVLCYNGGTCKVEEGKPTCKCYDEFEGEDCQIHKCASLECRNDGKCVVKEGDVFCDCPIKYTGKYCEKARCSRYYPCENGGICNDDEVCNCLPGTNGELCDVIDECAHLCPKQSDVNCTYDVKGERAYCECIDTEFGFNPETQECKRTCDEERECKNGAACTDKEYSRFCTCLEGTTGDLCEVIPDCKDVDCGEEASCQYDVKIQSFFCQCNNNELVLNYADFTCKKPCNESWDCFNGGTCIKDDSSGYCHCLDGTKGDFCEDVPGCINKECGSNAKCEYDVKRKIAMCKCTDEKFAFDPIDYKCKELCYNSSDCLNGGSCVGSERNKFCRCLKGTDGDYCEKVPGCDDIDCGSDAICAFNSTREAAHCMCNDEFYSYDVISKECKLPCVHDSMCRNEGLCMYRGYDRFCHCPEGTSGHFCENVDICNKLCGTSEDVVCKYDLGLKIAECRCRDEKQQFDVYTKTCKKCDCGGKEISCNIRNGRKICVCPDGYKDQYGKCVDVNMCGETNCVNGKCIEVMSEEICICYEGYSLERDGCKKKKCTDTPCYNGTCIVRDGEIEECVCPAGYTLEGSECTRGECREDTCYGGECKIIDGELTCKCPEKFHLDGIGCYETVCVIQNCFGGKCVVEDDEEICTCKEGYFLENDVCKKILCEEKNCYGGKCHIKDGIEECECLPGYSVVEDVCVKDHLTPF